MIYVWSNTSGIKLFDSPTHLLIFAVAEAANGLRVLLSKTIQFYTLKLNYHTTQFFVYLAVSKAQWIYPVRYSNHPLPESALIMLW